MRWKIECVECGKKASFADAKDVTQSKWTILAWIVPSGEPRCICDECEYGKPRKKRHEDAKE